LWLIAALAVFANIDITNCRQMLRTMNRELAHAKAVARIGWPVVRRLLPVCRGIPNQV